MRWGPPEKREVARQLELAGWTRDDFCRRRGFPQLRKKKMVVTFGESRSFELTRVTRDGVAVRYSDHVADIGPFCGRGWIARTVEAIEKADHDYWSTP